MSDDRCGFVLPPDDECPEPCPECGAALECKDGDMVCPNVGKIKEG